MEQISKRRPLLASPLEIDFSLHLHQERLNPVMVLLLGDRSRHRGPLSQTEPLPESDDQCLQLGPRQAANGAMELLDHPKR